MTKYPEYRYHLAALFAVAVWGATFVSTKVLIANSLTPAEIFVLRVIGRVAVANDFRQRVANEQPILRTVGVKP